MARLQIILWAILTFRYVGLPEEYSINATRALPGVFRFAAGHKKVVVDP